MKTIRLYATQDIVKKQDMSFLSDRFIVLPSCRIFSDVNEVYEEDDHSFSDFSIFIIHEIPIHRETYNEWFERMLHPIIDYSNFTYIVFHKLFESTDYSLVLEKYKNIKFLPVPWRLESYNEILKQEMKTIRLFGNGNIIRDHNIDFLSNRFIVLPSCKIDGNIYEPFDDEDHSFTDFSILIMHEWLTDREPQHEWFERMLHPIIDYSNFTYIIFHKICGSTDYTSVIEKYNNIKIKYVPSLKEKCYKEVINSLIG